MNDVWFYTTKHGAFGDGRKFTRYSTKKPYRMDNYQSRGFTRNIIENISRSVRAYVYLDLTSQIQARSTTVGNSASATETQ